MRLSYLATTPEAAPFALAWNGDLESIAGRLAEIGYEGIELQVRDPQEIDLNRLETILHNAGIAVSGVGTAPISIIDGLHLIDADPEARRLAYERFEAVLQFAAAFGVDASIGRFRGHAGKGRIREEGIAWLRAAMERFLPLAERLGVRIVLEPQHRLQLDYLNDISETVTFVRSFGSAALTFECDLYHIAPEERSIVGALVRAQLSGHMSYVQVSDSNRLAPGWGHFNWSDIIDSLRASGYDGWIAVECIQHPNSERCAVQAHAALRGVIDAPVT